MRMKEDRGAEKPWPKPAYNVQMGTEGQFIVGFSVHDRAGDTGCLIPHLEQVRQNTGGRLPQNVVADAGYGSEENYAYLEQHGRRELSQVQHLLPGYPSLPRTRRDSRAPVPRREL